MIRTRIPVLYYLGLVGLAVFVMSCRKQPSASETRQVLGTNVTVTVYDEGAKQADLKAIFDDVFSLMQDWDKRVLVPGSLNQMDAIARGAGTQSVQVDAPTYDLLSKAIRLYDQSGKVFDIRYGPMLDLWGFDKSPHVPSQAEIDTAKGLVERGGMFIAGHSILLAKKGMRFDLRDFGAGYIFDLAAARLTEKGVHSAMISCPYLCRTIGDAPDKRGFKMPLLHPLKGTSPWADLWIPTGGTAFAAANLGRFEAGGKVYHRLLDPRTGFPGDKTAGVALQAPDAATAQALAYAAFIAGSIDGFDAAGKALVGGTVIVRNNNSKLAIEQNGSLADKFQQAQ